MGNINQNFPLLPIRNAIVFPGVALAFLVKRPVGVGALKRAQANGNTLVTVAQRDGSKLNPAMGDLFRVGTLARIEQISGDDIEGYQVVVRGISRFHISEIRRTESYFTADGETWADRQDAEPETLKVLFENTKKLALEILSLLPGETQHIEELMSELHDPILLTHLASAHLDLPIEKKQELLENLSIRSRLLEVLNLMQRQKDALVVQSEIQNKMANKISRSQREAILREQMRTIREELGDEESGVPSEDLRKRIEEAGMSEEAKKIAEQELKRLESIGPSSPESHVIRTYIDWLLAMPWNKESPSQIDINEAARTLNEDHAGLDKIKRRILEHLAVMKLRGEHAGSILCFVGPPGVGKTSLGQSIAKALGRKFVRASLGGVRDESEIRGHRRTYIGAMPGRVIQGIKRAGERNPVMMLDEIDKLSLSYQGDPAAALLEVLDPEQNSTFMDHYLDVPFDLSRVVFIATANSLETIPAPLLDRMEIIELSGYTLSEKLDIAKRYLVPKQLKAHGLAVDQVSISDEVLIEVIAQYTREAGVRNLQRKIGALCRAAAVRVIKDEAKAAITVESSWLDEVLGTSRHESEVSERTPHAGVATGLAWTPVGGEILFIEGTSMPGSGHLTLTGQLGDVMKESAQIALSLVRSRLSAMAPNFDFSKRDIHVHVPAGAIPKDGPSAGITMLSALASMFTGRTIDPKIAMTGEVTLRGLVMPVGGIKEKVIAAHRAGIKKIIMSKRNQKDLRDVPAEVLLEMQFEFVESVVEVLKLTLGVDVLSLPSAQTQGPQHAIA